MREIEKKLIFKGLYFFVMFGIKDGGYINCCLMSKVKWDNVMWLFLYVYFMLEKKWWVVFSVIVYNVISCICLFLFIIDCDICK